MWSQQEGIAVWQLGSREQFSYIAIAVSCLPRFDSDKRLLNIMNRKFGVQICRMGSERRNIIVHWCCAGLCMQRWLSESTKALNRFLHADCASSCWRMFDCLTEQLRLVFQKVNKLRLICPRVTMLRAAHNKTVATRSLPQIKRACCIFYTGLR